MTNGRLNVGLFICHLDNDYAYDLCKGVDYAIKELDANLYIFPGMYINAAYNDPLKAHYDYQYNSVFYYASTENLDVLIVSIGTIGSFLSESDIKSFLDNFKDIPILTLEMEVPGYNYLYVDGRQGLKDAIEHLIHAHHKKRIGFVSGRKGNADAAERLNVYKETMEANGFAVEDKLIVHGNFSEFCEEIVGELIDNNPDLDAIVFANDQMALGGYNEMKRRGIDIGRDIVVTGFDDAPAALALVPNLSTVNANVSDLGYQSVYEAINVLKSGHTKQSILSSSFIKRQSCGCTMGQICGSHKKASRKYDIESLDSLVDEMEDTLLNEFSGCFVKEQIRDTVRPLFRTIMKATLDPNVIEYPTDDILEDLKKLLFSDLTLYFSFNHQGHLLDTLTAYVLEFIEDTDKRISFLLTSNAMFSAMNDRNSSIRYNDKRDYQIQVWNASYIARDTIDYGKDNDTCFNSLMERLQCLSFDSSYVYLYDDPIMQRGDGSWKIPETLILQSYDNDMKSVVLNGQRIRSVDVFDNPYTPKNRRCTFILNPIFTNEQQHGVFVCEIDIRNFHHIYSADLQLGTAFKFLHLIKEQMSTQKQLMLSLQEIHDKNNQLNHLSVSDELTGLYNRRGFMDKTTQLITASENEGRKAIIVYADMDNLKLVNDKFGHKDGDFALKSIANTLRSSFRDTDIVGRIGGDEFVAFAFLDSDDFVEELQSNLKKHSKQVNETCGKPYYIDISVGISECTCSPSTSIEDIMSEADTALYVNKKYKRMSVLKN